METEIICISSDDESESPKENKKKVSLNNSIEKSNVLFAHTKIEMPSNDDEKVEGNNLKRKISQINEERSPTYHNTKKKQKLSKSNTIQDLSKEDKDNIVVVDICSNKDREGRIEKPKLVVKERKKVSYIEHDTFPLFISLCLQKCHNNDRKDMEKIVDKLKRRYEDLDPVYASSEEFTSFLNEKREAIMNNDQKLYVYIEEVKNEMKRRMRRPSISQNNNTYDAVPSTSYAKNNLSVNQNVVESGYEDNENIEDKNRSLETNRKIKQLLHTMEKCESIIKRLEEEEVDFDDEENSNYMKVERYKQRMVELYNKLCELTGDNADAERAYLRPKSINTTRISSVDHAITNFINSKISKHSRLKKSGVFTDDLIFPDYRDILECVGRCNDKKNLGLDEKRQIQMAKKAFIQVGEYLQRARQNDYWDTFSLYLENTEEDPAIKDKELAKKLRNNCNEGEKRLSAIFEKYTRKQEQMKLQDFNDGSSVDEENEEENSIDEENEGEDEDYSAICNLSDEDNDSDNDMDEENSSLVKKTENNISAANVEHRIDEIIPNKIKTDTQEKHNNKATVKSPAKENSVIVSEGTSKIIDEQRTCEEITSNTVITTKNIRSIIVKTQGVSLSSMANCTNAVNRIEEDVPEVITDSPAEVVTENEAELMSENAAEMTTEVITSDITEVVSDDATETITRDGTETATADVTEMATEIVAETSTIDAPSAPETTTRHAIETAKTAMRHVAETAMGDAAETAMEDAAETAMGDAAGTAMGDAAEIITADAAEIITEDVAEMTIGNKDGNRATKKATAEGNAETAMGDAAEMIAGDVLRMMTGDVVEVTVTDTAKMTKKVIQTTKNVPSDKQIEEEKKPLLRVRSFAKPPMTWEDGRHKMDKSPQENPPKETNQAKDVIDLTNELNVNKSPQVTIQLGNTVVPVVKAKHQTLVIPSGSNIISVQNITNNYLKVDRRTGQIISPVRNVYVPTIIRVPSAQATTTQQKQPENVNTTKNEVSSKRNETVLRIIQPNRAVVTKKLTGQVISKQVNTHSSSKPK